MDMPGQAQCAVMWCLALLWAWNQPSPVATCRKCLSMDPTVSPRLKVRGTGQNFITVQLKFCLEVRTVIKGVKKHIRTELATTQPVNVENGLKLFLWHGPTLIQTLADVWLHLEPQLLESSPCLFGTFSLCWAKKVSSHQIFSRSSPYKYCFWLFNIYFYFFPYRVMWYGRAYCNEYVSQTWLRLPGWSQEFFLCIIPKIQNRPWNSGNDFSFSSLKVKSPQEIWSLSQVPGWPVSVSVGSWEVCSSGSYKGAKAGSIDGNENIPVHFDTLGSI